MKKNSIEFRSLYEKYQKNCQRIDEIADVCEKEQRERNEEETAEYNALSRDNQLLSMRMATASIDFNRENPDARAQAEKLIRENAAMGRRTELMFYQERDFTGMVVSDAAAGKIIPLNIQDILKPLEEGFILDKVGLPMPTGLAGDYVWPCYEAVDATVLAEGASLSDTKIPFSYLQASPARIGLAIPVSNQALNQTAGVLEMIVRQVMPKAVQQLLNKILFSTEAVNAAASSAGLVGPFVAASASPVSLSSTPTFLELNRDMKAKALESGIDGEHMCWIMTKSMQAILEGTPINSNGIYVPMIQNGMLCGLPVYTTNAIRKTVVSGKKATKSEGVVTWADYTIQSTDTIKFKVSGDSEANALATISASDVSSNDIAQVTVYTEYIGIGDWRYQPMGLFGSLRFTVDPFSKARQDAVDFVLNCDYATKTLRPEGFKVGQVAAVSNS